MTVAPPLPADARGRQDDPEVTDGPAPGHVAAVDPTTRARARDVHGVVPVAVRVAQSRSERLTRLVEGALGWPVVDVDDPVLPPVALVADVGSLRTSPPTTVPVVVLVGPRDDPTVAACAGAVADAVLPWPPTVEQLRAAVRGRAARETLRPWCVVAGASGGVGTSTVALALGGIRSWSVGRTLVAASGPTHVPDAPRVDPPDLSSPALWLAGASVPGLPELRVVGLRRGGSGRPGAGAVPTVVDVGVAPDPGGVGLAPDVLVVAPDGAGLAAAETTPAGVVVVVGTGPVPVTALARAAAPRSVAPVAHDPRVAAAAHAGRHPGDAPGSWLRPLGPVVAALDPRGRPS